MIICTPIMHFKRDNKVTITYVSGERREYNMTYEKVNRAFDPHEAPHAPMILMSGYKTDWVTYECWSNKNDEFCFEEREEILEVKLENGEITYGANEQYILGMRFKNGYGVKKDLEEAEKFFGKMRRNKGDIK